MVAVMMRYYHQPYSEIKKMPYMDILFFVNLSTELEKKEGKELQSKINEILSRQRI